MIGVNQYEIPKARVNITLDIETGGAKKKKELPLKLLVLADFTKNKSSKTISQRERIKINKNNFDAVLKTLSPQLILTTPNAINHNKTDLKSTLNFQSIKDFLPQNVASQIPELRNLIAMRNLLKDLKANILDNSVLRQELENVIKNQKQLQMLKKELQQFVPLQ
ncbi:type VI secretion system contractile sheath small subunit [soil metagenome]